MTEFRDIESFASHLEESGIDKIYVMGNIRCDTIKPGGEMVNPRSLLTAYTLEGGEPAHVYTENKGSLAALEKLEEWKPILSKHGIEAEYEINHEVSKLVR